MLRRLPLSSEPVSKITKVTQNNDGFFRAASKFPIQYRKKTSSAVFPGFVSLTVIIKTRVPRAIRSVFAARDENVKWIFLAKFNSKNRNFFYVKYSERKIDSELLKKISSLTNNTNLRPSEILSNCQ